MAENCPTHLEIDAFFLRDTPLADRSGLFQHIENCPACMAYLASQAGEPFNPGTSREFTPNQTASLPLPNEPGQFLKQTLVGDYQVVRLIGHGGMGEVYEGLDRKLNRRVALKVLNVNKLSSDTLKRIDREAAIQSHLKHPDIVTIYEFRKAEKPPLIVMELVDGQPLSQVLLGKPISPRKAAAVLARLARAIHYAHSVGVLHRDLKPSNILIDGEIADPPGEGLPTSAAAEPWSLKVIDFGLSKWLEGDDGPSLTLSTNIVGTPAYIAPELTHIGPKRVGPSADIYALGVILYECLIGRPPFVAENALQTLDLIRHREPVAPITIRPDLPRDLNTICLKCLEKEPGKRYATALELADELDRYLGGFPIHARPIGPLARGGRWCRRNRSLAAALGAVSTLLLVLIVGSIYFGYSQARLRQAAVDSDTQSRLALENLQQQSTQNTNIAYFTVGLFGLVKPDELGRPISIVKFLEAAERDLQSGKVETLEGKTTFLICVAMAFDRVGEVAKADRMLAAAEETLTTTITHDFSSAPYIKGYLIRAFLQQKKPEKAIFWLKDALSNLEKDKRLVTHLGFGFLEQLADAALAVNRPKDAIPWLEKTLAIQQATPAEAKRDTSGLRRQLARLYKADGDRNR